MSKTKTMVPSLMHLSMRSVLRNKLPHIGLPRSIQGRLQGIKKGGMYNSDDLDALHYYLDLTPQDELANDPNWCCVSIVSGRVDAFKLCLQYNCNVNIAMVMNILRYDQVEMFEALSEEQRDMITVSETFEIAATNLRKTTKCLEYLYRTQPKKNHPSTVMYTKTAAEHGNVAALELLHRNGCPMNVETTHEAIKSGSVACLKYAIDNGVYYNADRRTMLNASYNKRYDMFKFLHSQGHAMDAGMWNYLIYDEAGDMIEYMISHDCPFDERTTAYAALVGNVSILKRLHEAGCPWDERVLVNTIKDWDKRPHLECFKYALKEGAPLSPKILYDAAMHNTLQILKMAIEAGCPLPQEDLVYTAARCGSLSCLKHLHKTHEITVKHLRSTITFGRVNCLKYILTHTYLDIDDIMEYDLSDIKCYEYLKQRSADDPDVYQIDPTRVMNGAAMNGCLKMVKYLRKNGVKWPPGLLMDVFEEAPFYMLHYMVNNGANIKELDMKIMLEILLENVKNNKLVNTDQSGDSRRKLRLIGTLFGLGPRER